MGVLKTEPSQTAPFLFILSALTLFLLVESVPRPRPPLKKSNGLELFFDSPRPFFRPEFKL
jgi:hypothetical protein